LGKYSIKDINKFLITDDDAGLTYLGGNQEWYGKFFRRLAGCGPTAAANIFKYLGADKLPAGSVRETDTLRQYKTLMNEMWEHVTPTSRGVYCTEIFYDGCLSFAGAEALISLTVLLILRILLMWIKGRPGALHYAML